MCIEHLRLLPLGARTASLEILSFPPLFLTRRGLLSFRSALGLPHLSFVTQRAAPSTSMVSMCDKGADSAPRECSRLAGECPLCKEIVWLCKIRLFRAAPSPPAEPERQRKSQAIVWHARLRASELCSLQESVAAGCAPHADLPGCLPRRKCKLSSNDGALERSQGARVFSKD